MNHLVQPSSGNKSLIIKWLQVLIRLTTFVLFSFAVNAQGGRVGINTASPAATLHVADSSVLFSASNTLNLTTQPPIQGAGARMMWFVPRKAFRVGAVQGNRWDRDSIGNYSFAANNNNRASAYYSAAFGSNTIADGYAATSFGEYTRASGDYSFASGVYTRTSAAYSAAFGVFASALGFSSVAFGEATMADAYATFAAGFGTLASEFASSSFGSYTKAIGSNSSAFGNRVFSKSQSMFALGAYNDSTNYDVFQWVETDPLFVIGNGTSNSNRKNALTLLKNGNLGLYTKSPAFRLHVVNDNPADGGYLEGIMIENTNTGANVGEAALSFRNKSLPSNKQWTIGMNQNPNLAFSYGINFDQGSTLMMLDTLGRFGINTVAPQANLHVVRNNPSGGPFSSNAMAIFESNNISYIQLSSENVDDAGILSGNQDDYIRSGVIFRTDSSLNFRTGGNSTKMWISKAGNVGINTGSPTARLHVNGTARFGVNGTVISEIIKATVNANVPSVAANGGTVSQLFTVANAVLTSAVSVSPDESLPAGLVIASARVSGAQTVEVRFVNTTASAIDPPAMDYHFVIVR